MPQIRKDYLLDKYVIIATERGKRPTDFKSKKEEESPKEKCPFCPGNEHMLPGIIDEVKKGDDWIVRAIYNKYKAAAPKGSSEIKTENEFYTFGDAYGEHEVVIESPNHNEEMEDLDEKHVFEILKLIQKRVNKNYHKGSAYVSVFKNRGKAAGASLSHPHHQIVAYNIIPSEIKRNVHKSRIFKDQKGICPYCLVIDKEKGSDRRIFENNDFVSFTPYASRFNMESWILPKRCVYSITELNDDEVMSLVKVLMHVLQALNKIGYPAYNLLYKMSSPRDKDFHFRIEVAPRLAKWAGFELETGTIINTVLPEDAAKFYRGEE